jgi:hypothetical protein
MKLQQGHDWRLNIRHSVHFRSVIKLLRETPPSLAQLALWKQQNNRILTIDCPAGTTSLRQAAPHLPI